jgi:type IV secretion system protein VirB11
MIAPASIGGTSVSIRNPAKRRFVLDDYVHSGRASEDHAHAIRQAIRRRDNVWVVGGTSSGKSTMMGAITREPEFYNDRLIVIQDRLELLCEKAANKVMWLVDEITMQQAVMHALRMFIQRLVIGEVRDGSMWDVVKAANTGHDGGLLSLHANDPHDAIDRAVQLSLEATHAPSERWIRNAVGTIVWMGKGRRVLDVLRVDNGKFQSVAGAS